MLFVERQAASDRAALWEKLGRIPGVYVPHFYAVSYAADQTIAAVEQSIQEIKARMEKEI